MVSLTTSYSDSIVLYKAFTELLRTSYIIIITMMDDGTQGVPCAFKESTIHNLHYVSQLAVFFINAQAKRSVMCDNAVQMDLSLNKYCSKIIVGVTLI